MQDHYHLSEEGAIFVLRGGDLFDRVYQKIRSIYYFPTARANLETLWDSVLTRASFPEGFIANTSRLKL
jgi:hypothetical protein